VAISSHIVFPNSSKFENLRRKKGDPRHFYSESMYKIKEIFKKFHEVSIMGELTMLVTIFPQLQNEG
jgi:hypothetical protein